LPRMNNLLNRLGRHGATGVSGFVTAADAKLVNRTDLNLPARPPKWRARRRRVSIMAKLSPD